MIKTILFTILFFSTTLFSATPEQIERYLSVSNSEEQLIELERQFSQMQNSINSKSADTEASSSYDMQMLSIRFRDYLQKHLSENEMDEILLQYRNVVLLKFVSVQGDPEYDEKEAQAYMQTLQTEENASIRMDLLSDITNTLYNDEHIGILFDNLMKPFLENSKGSQNIDDEKMKQRKEGYIKRKRAAGRVEIAYITREFTVEELEYLLKIMETSAISHESKAVFGATAYALKEFFLSMASRYDASKH